jgi:hypothetical protein
LYFSKMRRIPDAQAIMSERGSSEFIRLPTFAEYFQNFGYEQRLAFLAFYDSFCDVRYGEPVEHLDGRDGDFPFPVGHIRSADNTVYALNSTFEAHEDPADYSAVVAQLRDGRMEINELEIMHIQHVPHGKHEGIDKIINAKWHETSKRVSIRLGHLASITTQDQTGLIVQLPGFVIG